MIDEYAALHTLFTGVTGQSAHSSAAAGIDRRWCVAAACSLTEKGDACGQGHA
jgi:hypothetical protein